MRFHRAICVALVVGMTSGCSSRSTPSRSLDAGMAVAPDDASIGPGTGPAGATGLMHARRVRNTIAYVPPACFTNTRGDDGRPKNPCYPCHTRSEPPNFVNDEDL